MIYVKDKMKISHRIIIQILFQKVMHLELEVQGIFFLIVVFYILFNFFTCERITLKI